ncbi:hypothetical protein [Streptomyces ardesiacus]|uniref:hypothetical protein n=1 Tax=Streptomyces ardesiacus TaxID=285564 RepID=UPI003405B0BC
MPSYADSLRGLADFHDEQATSLERDSHLDALDWHPSSKAAERAQAIKAHRAKARKLRAEAEQLRKA